MSAPLVVNTVEGTVWTRRPVVRDGEVLYAPAAIEERPEFVMATYAELEKHGIGGSADVLPVPVGAEPQEPKPIAYAKKVTDAQLLLAHPSEKQRAAEWPWDMWCRICHIRPTSHRTEAEALEAADQHVKLYHAPQDEVHKLMAAGGLAELERLRARVSELVAERHVTNEALDDAVRALRERQVEREALVERLRAGQQWQRGRNPELVSENYVSQSELRAIFGIPLTAPRDGEPVEAGDA